MSAQVRATTRDEIDTVVANLPAYGVPIKSAGSLSTLISLPTVLTGIVRHAMAGAFADRRQLCTLIVPMGIGSVLGGVIGGLLVSLAPAAIIKFVLGLLLIWSAWKVFAHHGPVRSAQN